MRSRLAVTAALLLAAAGAQAELPVDVQRDLWKDYGSAKAPTYYREGRIDLDRNGREDIVVHLVGPKACRKGGCTTVVYAWDRDGRYRRVSAIAATALPIGASAVRSAGWRDLVVQARGSRAKSDIVELFFDGASYPANAAARDPMIVAAKDPGDIIIGADTDKDADMLLTKPEPADADSAAATTVETPRRGSIGPDIRHTASATPTTGKAATFTCARAAAHAEKAVCASPELTALDRELAAALAKSLKGQPEERQAALRSEQQNWTIARNACAKSDDAGTCIHTAYRRRLVALQVQQGEATGTPRRYACEGESMPLDAVFYTTTDPAAVAVTWGKRQILLYAAAAPGGSRYAASDAELREQQGKVVVTWSGKWAPRTLTLTCTPQP